MRWLWIDRIIELVPGKRLVAIKNRNCADFPLRNADGEYAEGVILDLDLWLLLPR